MVLHGYASHSYAASWSLRLQHRRQPVLKSSPLIARARQNILRANAVSPCWSYKMGGRFSSIMPMADRHGDDGRSSAGQKAFGASRQSPRCATDCSSSMIPSPIRSPSVAGPGSAFIYGPSHLQIFSELLRRKLKGHDVISYFEGRVSNRLGLGRLNYK